MKRHYIAMFLFVMVVILTVGSNTLLAQPVPSPFGSPADNCIALAAVPGQGVITITVVPVRDCGPAGEVWVWYARYQPDPVNSSIMTPLGAKMVLVAVGGNATVQVEPGAYRLNLQVPPTFMSVGPKPPIGSGVQLGFGGQFHYYETPLVVVGYQPSGIPELGYQPYAAPLVGATVDEAGKAEFGVRLHGPTTMALFQFFPDGLGSIRQDVVEIAPNRALVDLSVGFDPEREVFGHLVDISTGVAGTYLVWDPRGTALTTRGSSYRGRGRGR